MPRLEDAVEVSAAEWLAATGRIHAVVAPAPAGSAVGGGGAAGAGAGAAGAAAAAAADGAAGAETTARGAATSGAGAAGAAGAAVPKVGTESIGAAAAAGAGTAEAGAAAAAVAKAGATGGVTDKGDSLPVPSPLFLPIPDVQMDKQLPVLRPFSSTPASAAARPDASGRAFDGGARDGELQTVVVPITRGAVTPEADVGAGMVAGEVADAVGMGEGEGEGTHPGRVRLLSGALSPDVPSLHGFLRGEFSNEPRVI